jgi:hypothetical protein
MSMKYKWDEVARLVREAEREDLYGRHGSIGLILDLLEGHIYQIRLAVKQELEQNQKGGEKNAEGED